MICHACGVTILVLPRHVPPGSRLWLVFPSRREGRQEAGESLVWPVVLRFQCSPDVSLGISALAGFSEPQIGPTVGVSIIARARCAAIWVLLRRLWPGSRLWRYFRAPERANSSSHF